MDGRFLESYRCVDELRLSGVLHKKNTYQLTINHWTKISLGPAEFLVTLALFSHSAVQRRERAPVKFKVSEEYVTGARIAEAIARYRSRLVVPPSVMKHATDTDVTRYIGTVRAKIEDLLLNPNLIINVKGRGYRLEIPPGNARLDYVQSNDARGKFFIPWKFPRSHLFNPPWTVYDIVYPNSKN